MAQKQTYLPFFGSRIFWIALVVIAAFTAMIISGKLVLDGAAVTAFLLAVFSGVVGLSRREQGDAGAPSGPAAAMAMPPELVDTLAAIARSMARQGGDALDDYVDIGAAEEDEKPDEKPDEESEEEKEGDDES